MEFIIYTNIAIINRKHTNSPVNKNNIWAAAAKVCKRRSIGTATGAHSIFIINNLITYFTGYLFPIQLGKNMLAHVWSFSFYITAYNAHAQTSVDSELMHSRFISIRYLNLLYVYARLCAKHS